MASFDKRSVRRIADTVQFIERRPRSLPAPRPTRLTGWPGCVLAISNSVITRSTSQTSPGRGTALLQGYDGTTIAALADVPTGIPVVNPTDKQIASGTLMICAPIGRFLFVIHVYSCTDLS